MTDARSTALPAALPTDALPEKEIVAAGPFGSWLARMRDSLRGEGGTDVPCGTCVGCCVSSYYIPIRPRDAAARVHIPGAKLMRAAGQPPGHAMMAYESDGRCPMIDEANHCRIYEIRPQTCRDYDCRIFAAAGLEVGAGKPVINQRIRAWRFTYSSEADYAAHRAVLAAAAFIQSRRECFPGERVPTAATGIAVLAIKAYGVFLARPESDEATALAIIEASRKFDRGA